DPRLTSNRSARRRSEGSGCAGGYGSSRINIRTASATSSAMRVFLIGSMPRVWPPRGAANRLTVSGADVTVAFLTGSITGPLYHTKFEVKRQKSKAKVKRQKLKVKAKYK